MSVSSAKRAHVGITQRPDDEKVTSQDLARAIRELLLICSVRPELTLQGEDRSEQLVHEGNFLRAIPARPSSPVASNPRVLGSGVGTLITVSPSERVVLSLKLVPTANVAVS